MKDDQQRAFLAIVLSAGILMLWQFVVAPKYFPKSQRPAIENSNYKETRHDLSSGEQREVLGGNSSPRPSDKVMPKEALTQFKLNPMGGNKEVEFNSDFTISQIESVEHRPGEDFTYYTGLSGPIGPVFAFEGSKFVRYNFSWMKSGDRKWIGKNQNGLTIELKPDEKGRVWFKISSPRPFKIRYNLMSQGKESTLQRGKEREFVILSDKVHRYEFDDNEAGEGSVRWFGVDFDYQLFATTFEEKIHMKYQVDSVMSSQNEIGEDKGQLRIQSTAFLDSVKGFYLYKRKNYDELDNTGFQLKAAVDFGWFSILAVPLLRGLQFFYDFFPNYGVAIILLTFLVRSVTFPLQYKSFKSMKKMSLLQPELKKIQEKFKDNPQKLQKESLLLFKRAGTSPLSGCLPLLLQMPIFFAFYQVLFNSVELVGAPFYGWIQDLSAKDPYYVLPIVMTLAMFLQQKMTPSATADPTQKKVMLFMPLIFGFIMKDLPSGLSLYIFVSTVFGMGQQFFVNKRLA